MHVDILMNELVVSAAWWLACWGRVLPIKDRLTYAIVVCANQAHAGFIAGLTWEDLQGTYFLLKKEKLKSDNRMIDI